MVGKLRFGPGGFPRPAKDKGVLGAINWCKEHDLGCMELEWVHSVWLKEDKAAEVKKAAQKADVHLTAHGSYYINLNAVEPEKRKASRSRVVQAATRLWQVGGKSLTFHPAYYLGQDPKKVYGVVKAQFKKILAELNDAGVDLRISPETTGKPSQFGTYQELCKLAEEFEQVQLCVDFAHLHARSNGAYNSYDEFCKVLETVENSLGREGLDEMHIHLSGIEYGEKGERNHLTLADSDFNIPGLLLAWKDFNVGGWVVSESPIIEEDALFLQNSYK